MVARLMREMGMAGAVRGKPLKTTVSNKAAPCPLEPVNRQFQVPRPNMLRVFKFYVCGNLVGFHLRQVTRLLGIMEQAA
jgi:hypothetical protein